MRNISLKRKSLNESVAEWRDNFRHRVSRCEMCLKPTSAELLDVHECVTGSHRHKALAKNYTVLALHRLCHQKMETLTIAHQLAYLLRARPSDLNMGAYYWLTGRKWPEIKLIHDYLKKIKASEQPRGYGPRAS